MLTRILALVAVLLLAPSTLAHANARALSLESASLGIFAGNGVPLKEIPDLPLCCIKEKSPEGAESSNRREEYLRARYLDPGQGRFLGMDPYAGDNRIPISAHDYLYAGLDPVGRLDPTGMFTLSDLVGSMNIRGTLNTIGQVNFRNFAKNAVTGTMRTARALLNEAKVCFRTPRKCQLKVPVLIVGMETPETSQHIQDAILNENSATNIVHSPFWLTRKSPPHSRYWLRSNTNCAGRVRGVTSCDEYPFASTEEGGSGNQLRVSLRLVPVREQSLQGGLLSAFYTACRISTTRTSSNPIHDKRTFLVVPTPQSPGFPLCLR